MINDFNVMKSVIVYQFLIAKAAGFPALPQKVVENCDTKLKQMTEKLNERLAGRKTLGETFTLADIVLCETIINGPMLSGADWGEKFPNIKAYYDACCETLPHIKENENFAMEVAKGLKAKAEAAA